MHRFTDTDTIKYHIVTVNLQVHLKSKVNVPNERLYARPYLCIVTVVTTLYMTNRNGFKDILSKKFMSCQVTEMHLMTPKKLKCSAN